MGVLTVPPGDYWLSDPSYIFDDPEPFHKLIKEESVSVNGQTVYLVMSTDDGRHYVTFGPDAKYLSGGVKYDKGYDIGVDSGMICLIPRSIVPRRSDILPTFYLALRLFKASKKVKRGKYTMVVGNAFDIDGGTDWKNPYSKMIKVANKKKKKTSTKKKSTTTKRKPTTTTKKLTTKKLTSSKKVSTKRKKGGVSLSTKTKRRSFVQVKVKPDAVLSAVIGTNMPLPRHEIVKRVWVYIKRKDLQDPHNGRFVIPDSTLAQLLGTKAKVNAFGLVAKSIERHVRRL